MNPKKIPLSKKLRLWPVEEFITHKATGRLLEILQDEVKEQLPKNPRTLLKTQRTVLTKKLGSGEIYYFGIHLGLQEIRKYNGDEVALTFNIDGTKKQFWPILCMTSDSKPTSGLPNFSIFAISSATPWPMRHSVPDTHHFR